MKFSLDKIPTKFFKDSETLEALLFIKGLPGEVAMFGSLVVKGLEPNDIDIIYVPTEDEWEKEILKEGQLPHTESRKIFTNLEKQGFRTRPNALYQRDLQGMLYLRKADVDFFVPEFTRRIGEHWLRAANRMSSFGRRSRSTCLERRIMDSKDGRRFLLQSSFKYEKIMYEYRQLQEELTLANR